MTNTIGPEMTETPRRFKPRARQAAEEFARKLGTEAYPVGTHIAAVETIRDECGVSDSTAYNALKYLQAWGRLKVQHGMPSVVLPVPAGADQTTSEHDVAVAELRILHRQLGDTIDRLAQDD
ncbi:MAG TPA: hypothetical protein VK735_15275 [Pseudonocardia sp.]|uniref:hypothetical protein n=1 Tax=Pseudonocardia sp. TaxID=60912 RepID=UPI002CCF1AAF|nr:hypothetical protein [Pseudonocardia sp.]HTF48805.1 hypothetical protein [Pseudonocardia sp.]